MDATTNRSGGCQCGTIRYELTAAPEMLYACHCSDCQKQSSSAFGMSLIMAADDVSFVKGAKRLKTWETHGEDGRIKRCSFCPDCGSRIMHASDDPQKSVSIKAGSLDDTSWLKPVAHIWLQSAQPWLALERDQLHCFEREPDNEAQLQQQWRELNPSWDGSQD